MAKNSYKSYGDYARSIEKNEKLGYTAYVKNELDAANDDYLRAMQRAKREAISSLPTYGISAESLASAGLQSTGYAEYLAGISKNNYRAAAESAERALDASDVKLRKSYADYVKDYTASQEKLYASIVKDMSAGTNADYDLMLEYASGAGLSDYYAKAAANAAKRAVTEKLRRSVIDAINNQFYSEKESYEYALQLGLGEEAAKELSEYAKKMRESRFSSDYLNQIKENVIKENKK